MNSFSDLRGSRSLIANPEQLAIPLPGQTQTVMILLILKILHELTVL